MIEKDAQQKICPFMILAALFAINLAKRGDKVITWAKETHGGCLGSTCAMWQSLRPSADTGEPRGYCRIAQ